MSVTGPSSRLRLRRALGIVAVLAVVPAAAHADLSGQLGANKAKDRSLQGAIGADNQQVQHFQGRIDDLRQRLNGLQASVDAEQADLRRLQRDLRTARARLARLRLQARHDDRVLAAQLVGQYEAPRADMMTILLQSRGFAELLERADGLKAVARQNAGYTRRVRKARKAVAAQAVSLAQLETRQARVTESALAQRDEVDSIKIELIRRQYAYTDARAKKQSKLTGLRAERGRLQRRLVKLQAARAPAIAGSGVGGSGPGLPSGGAPSFASHGGSYGFFQAPGTNYSVGDEPRIAARLDAMGKALHLHLLGLSGYRSPQHSMEVGGFANDPHTRGQASDTPGVEGVPEGALNRYGLTRPFAGPAELDHVQLVGGAR